MNQKQRTFAGSEGSPCEKYLNKIFRQENYKKSLAPKLYQEKISLPMKTAVPKARPNLRHASPIQKTTAQVISALKDQGDHKRDVAKMRKFDGRTRSRSRSRNKDRESWGQLLQANKSRERISSFSKFDPLRTLHFLSKELCTKLEDILPNNQEVFQMISDIHHALKRIPPEVSAMLHNPQNEYTHSETSEYTRRNTLNRSCQTPPTLYQEDTEKFQKIMEENTYKLEASCKQLEIVCSNLQKEKEIAERELDEAKENVEFLCLRVKELENEMEELTNVRIKQLEEDKQDLQEKLDKAVDEINANPTAKQLRKLVDELKKQKLDKDEACAKLECEMTILKMEKEKFVTMLSVRDREVKSIQDEMSRIQAQVSKQLAKLNADVAKRSSSLKFFSDQQNEDCENIFVDVGDTTVSSVTTSESEREHVRVEVKQSPYDDSRGDSTVNAMTKKSRDNFLDKFEAEKDSASNKNHDRAYEELLKGLTPSVQALLTSDNV